MAPGCLLFCYRPHFLLPNGAGPNGFQDVIYAILESDPGLLILKPLGESPGRTSPAWPPWSSDRHQDRRSLGAGVGGRSPAMAPSGRDSSRRGRRGPRGPWGQTRGPGGGGADGLKTQTLDTTQKAPGRAGAPGGGRGGVRGKGRPWSPPGLDGGPASEPALCDRGWCRGRGSGPRARPKPHCGV